MNRLFAITALAAAGLTVSGVHAGGNCSSNKQASDGQCSGSQAVALAAFGGDRHGKDIVDTAVQAGSFKTLAAALKAADLIEPLKGKGPFTVFAPTDEAFAKLPAGTVETLLLPENKAVLTAILTYHVVPGKVTSDQVVKLSSAETLNGQRIDIATRKGKVMIDNATVVSADIKCSNGVIHVIDSVIIPSTDNIVETAVKAGSFETLAAALNAAHLVSTLSGDGPFTVFAPTDEAFAKLPAGTVETLLKPENRDHLVAILKYHVVPGRIYARDAVTAEMATTAEGSPVRIMIRNGRLMVNDANVIATDIEASNGVIHIIDEVILPEQG